MAEIKKRVWQIIGGVGTLLWISVFIAEPSFPSLDKLIFLIVFIGMIFSQGIEALRRFLPFVAVIFVYESFRGLATQLNNHVNYSLAPHFDRLVFGNLPTVYLQNWLWRGHVSWYDYVLYLPYMFHFIMPVVLGVAVWKTRENQYWRVIWTYITVAFAAFLTFWIIPAAPPWLASDNNYIQHIARISSDVWLSLGLHNFPTLYQHITPNVVAAIPSLHAAWATLLVIFVYKLYGRRWAALASIYPLLIYVGTVYTGEHYAFDIICGILYAFGAYILTPHLMRWARHSFKIFVPVTDKLPIRRWRPRDNLK